jgi:hypothetical protein
MSTAARTSVSTRLPSWKVATALFALNISLLASNSALGQASSTVGPPIIFVHGICSSPSDWNSVQLSVAAYLQTANQSLYPNSEAYIAVASSPSAGGVIFYDNNGKSLSAPPPTSARLFSIAFNPNDFGTHLHPAHRTALIS